MICHICGKTETNMIQLMAPTATGWRTINACAQHPGVKEEKARQELPENVRHFACLALQEPDVKAYIMATQIKIFERQREAIERATSIEEIKAIMGED